MPTGYPRYGNTVLGAPGLSTWLTIVKKMQGSEELYISYSSRDGVHWVHGGSWTHNLGATARIGLISMGGAGFVASFGYVHVYTLANP